MGGGLSSNYERRGDPFVVGCWTVCNAVHTGNGQNVSLWILDQEILKKTFPKSSEQQAYISQYQKSLQGARRLHHPHILKILEVQENPQYFEFTSEPVASCLKSHIGHLDSTDCSYIAFQMVDGLNFLHKHAKSVHFGVSPNSVLLTSDFSVKLFDLQWLTPLSDDGIVHPPFKEYRAEIGFPDIHYTAPEIIQGRQCTVHTDVFAFATTFCEMLTGNQLIDASKKEEYNVSQNPISKMQGMTSLFYTILQECLQPSATLRPTAEKLMTDMVFQTVQIKVLRYMDLIIAKDPRDKFEFFKSVSKVIPSFSQKIVQHKIIPVLINECRHEKKFSPVLIGPIIQAAKDFSVADFTTDVYNNLAFLTAVSDPPQIMIAFLQKLDIIFEKCDPGVHIEKVYPIIYTSLRSKDQVVVKECIKKLPLVLKSMDEQALTKNVVPLLMRIAERSLDVELIVTVIDCLSVCLPKVDNSMFLKYLVPKLHTVWKKYQEPIMIPAYWNLFNTVKGSEVNTISYAIPVAADIAANTVCPPYYQQILASWILGFVTKYKTVNELDGVADPIQQNIDFNSSEMATLFDPLAEELSITPAQQQFDFTFSSGTNNQESLF